MSDRNIVLKEMKIERFLVSTEMKIVIIVKTTDPIFSYQRKIKFDHL